ncbi:triacylglycerol lipase [Candidatus Magnetomoraceae bacterium gMMP-1]
MKDYQLIKLNRLSTLFILFFTILSLCFAMQATAQDFPFSKYEKQFKTFSKTQSSPFSAPQTNDITFVVDDASGLDTGCTFSSGGPLIFSIPVTRYVGDIQKLLTSGAIEATANLRMPAYDVDFNGTPPSERDRVLFNGHVVETEFLTGDNGIWKLNSFKIPVEWINFPDDPGPGGEITPALNEIQIDIDVLSAPEDRWCTAIDWACLTIKVARPDLFVHGIFSSGNTWTGTWTNTLSSRGIPFETIDMGRLDSIASNANKIETKVNELMTRWGIDKINIVAHSKGGIDSRHFAEKSNKVARLIQIGTPNAGSELADYIQGGSIMAFGILGNMWANLLAGGSGGYQLTTSYMNIYNTFHGYNPETSYYSLAGDYSGGGFVSGFLNSILPGEDDIIVPLYSVHALPYATHLSYSSSGTNIQARHTQQTKSQDILNMLISINTEPVRTKTFKKNKQSSILPTNTSTVASTLSQDETQVHQIPIDDSGSGAFTIFYGNGNLDMVLVSPSGVRIDPAMAQTDPNIGFEADEDIEGFKNEVYEFNAFEIGLWNVEITGTQILDPPGEESYIMGAWLDESSIELTALTNKETYASGEDVVVNATIVDGQNPVLAANVSADIRLPDNTTMNIILLDNGILPDQVADDGVYAGVYNETSESGNYHFVVIAQDDQIPFSREKYLQVPVSASGSNFSGVFSDNGIDTNSNGLFDELLIEVECNITEDAEYILVGELRSSDDSLIGSLTNRVQLSPGLQNIGLAFDGEAIFETGMDGPYSLSLITLAEETPDGDVLPLAELNDAYDTNNYSYRDFERTDAILIKGTGTDRGIDTNGNRLFDQLEVVLDLDMQTSGEYDWTARLVDSNETEIGFASNSGWLADGSVGITLVFDGKAIGQNLIDGPYEITDLLIFGDAESQVLFEVYTTTAYSVREFEGNKTRICLSLGDNPDNSLLRPDVDKFRFNIAESQEVTITLEPDPNGTYDGERADFIFKSKSNFLIKRYTRPFPSEETFDLQNNGKCLIYIIQGYRQDRFNGNYCLTLESSGTAWQTLEADQWVE